jgi:hypothetical protein
VPSVFASKVSLQPQRLARPGGVRSVIAECLFVKFQLLILPRSRQRAPNQRLSDRLVPGWCTLLVPSSCLTRSGIVLKPSPLCKTIQELEIRQTQADRARFVERTLQPAGSGDYFSRPLWRPARYGSDRGRASLVRTGV